MGDRCTVWLTLHGRIETVEALNEVLEALEADGFHDDEAFGRPSDPLSAMADALSRGIDVRLTAHEVNWAEIDTSECALQEHGVAYQANNEEGGGYGAESWSWVPGRAVVRAVHARDEGAAIGLADLQKALANSYPLDAVQHLVDVARAASGEGMPTFGASESVRAEINRRTAQKAA